MLHSGSSVFHGVNPNQKKKTAFILDLIGVWLLDAAHCNINEKCALFLMCPVTINCIFPLLSRT